MFEITRKIPIVLEICSMLKWEFVLVLHLDRTFTPTTCVRSGVQVAFMTRQNLCSRKNEDGVTIYREVVMVKSIDV